MQSLAVDVHRAKRLAKAGQELMAEYSFTKDVLESKCLELKSLCKKLEIMFTKKRQSLLKFLELFQTLESISKVPRYLFIQSVMPWFWIDNWFISLSGKQSSKPLLVRQYIRGWCWSFFDRIKKTWICFKTGGSLIIHILYAVILTYFPHLFSPFNEGFI